MKNTWLKKICMGLILSIALGAAACSSQDGTDTDTETVLQNAQGGEIPSDENQGNPVEIHTGSGHLVGDGTFTSVTFDDGTGIACDHGDCNF